VLRPLVSIVTPVYKDAEFLAECIESVLAQTYTNWNYVIVDNCSTDGSLAIAQKFAVKDARIRIVSNEQCLPIIANHNHAIRQISSESKYCKVVFADDWLLPTCIEELVGAAERHLSIGVVGAYSMDGQAVLWAGPPHPCYRAPGYEVCRRTLLAGTYVFGTMTSLLVRSDLIRKRARFFNERNLHADLEACFDLLQESDFAFVHQVLSCCRARPQSNTSSAIDFESIILGNFVTLVKYGPIFLNGDEYSKRYRQLRWDYYRVLARNVFRIRPSMFWRYHRDTLAAFDEPLDWRLVAAALIPEIGCYLTHPIQSIGRVSRWWSRAFNRSKENGFARSQG
jgi:glycosyltransferase involved in cell wall biosynthesis